ncbi:MAG: hypothetical protein Phog2KO_39360 [Phototrophicaceae bacterium]
MPDLDELIEAFYKLNYSEDKNPYILNARIYSQIPEVMITSREEENYGRVRWKLTKHRDDINPDFEVLEEKIGVVLPYSFKLWHSRYFTLNGFSHLIYLPISPSNDPLYGLRQQIFNSWHPQEIRDSGLIMFGSERNGIGPICFDVRKPVQDNDYPIVIWDHEYPSDRVSSPIFSSFSKLLECCVYYLSGNSIDWWVRDRRISKFAEIDPLGAGQEDQSYWSGWYDYLDEDSNE